VRLNPFKSLEGRIASLFLVLLIVVQVVGLLVIERGIDANARASISAELVNGEKVFRKLVEQSAQQHRFSAQILARDTAFVAAIGNGGEDERATIESALDNSARRARADLTMLIGGDGKLMVSSGMASAGALEELVRGLLERADRENGAQAIAVVDQKPVQIVVMPVKAPVTIAWIVMGFVIDRQIALDMRAISALDVALLTRDKDGAWVAAESTLAPQFLAKLGSDLKPVPDKPLGAFDLDINGSRYSARMLPIGHNGAHDARVLLAQSIDAATEQYSRLERTLVGLTLLGILVASVAAVLTAKRIALPLRELARTARRLERGDYRGQIAVRGDDEVGALAKAFDSMRDGIARREKEIRRLAYWDQLTNLPNRAQFVLMLDEALEQARKDDHALFVLMLDLDRFKHVNDVMGHSFGDDLLRQVAERLRLRMPDLHPAAKLARLGGDEFAVMLPDCTVALAQRVAAALLQTLELPLSLEDQTVDIGAGLGIAGFPHAGQSAEELLSMAEVAMYQAKQRNDGAIVYEPSMDTASAKSLGLLTELRNGIERGEFRLHLQPKLRLDTGEVIGAEALVRWQHPERGNVFPDDFIPFAEQTGFIRVLTRWVLDRSAALCSELAGQGIDLKFSVNLSTRDLMDQNLPEKFGEILARHRLSPASFCLEITESAIMDDPVRAQTTLERLHAMGVELSIDDFGTGYSSLAYLKRLPVDELKIDKSFVLNMENDVGDTKIVRSTIDLGHNMGLRVVAEGIESEAVWRLLAALGCDQGQGYFMSRPIPGEQMAAFIASWVPPRKSPLPYEASVS
jgi:diguanylate cyclase (GGDEF)-like protein